MQPVTVVLPLLLSIAAIGSQFSAAVADSEGAGGLIPHLANQSHHRCVPISEARGDTHPPQAVGPALVQGTLDAELIGCRHPETRLLTCNPVSHCCLKTAVPRRLNVERETRCDFDPC